MYEFNLITAFHKVKIILLKFPIKLLIELIISVNYFYILSGLVLSITRGQAVILLSCAVAVSSIFMTLSLRNQVTAYQDQVELLQSRNVNNSVKISELERETAEYKSRIIELQNEVNRNERIVDVWRTYRDQLEEALIENARLKGLLLERELDENFTSPSVKPRKEIFLIGDTISFIVWSEVPLYGSYFMIWNPEDRLVWEGDPISNWEERGVWNISTRWIVPYIGQTAYLEPMLLEEDMITGEWTWSYRFSDMVNIEGTFIVAEQLEEVIQLIPDTG